MIRTRNDSLALDKTFAKKTKIAIVRTDYYQEYNGNMEKHARAKLKEAGLPDKNVQTFIVPGSWEITVAVKAVAASKKFDAIITFGVILKGETLHFDMIANEVGKALMELSVEYTMPIALEVLAVFDIKQAAARAADNDKNKGGEAAIAVIKTLQTLHEIKN